MVTKAKRRTSLTRVGCLTVLLLLLLSAAASVEAKSFSQEFAISVIIPHTVSHQQIAAKDTRTDNVQTTTEEVVRKDTTILLKTTVCK